MGNVAYTFQKSQKVKLFNPRGKRAYRLIIDRLGEGPYIVISTEDVIDSGLSQEEQKEVGHHQLIGIREFDGRVHKHSGILFVPV